MNTNIHLGHVTIDSHHQVLLKLFENLKKSSQENNFKIVETISLDMTKYALEHFRYEEELMMRANYPDDLLEEHMVQHALFKAKMIDVMKKLKNKEIDHDLQEYIKNWFIVHIKIVDKKLVDYIDKK